MKKMNPKIMTVVVSLALLGCGLLAIGNILVQNKKKERIAEELERLFPAKSIEEKKTEAEPKVVSHQLPKATKETPVSIPEALERAKEIEALIEKLKDSDFQTSQEAADKLFSLGELAVPKLKEALLEASVALKGQIVFLLGRIKDREATPTLIEVLRRDENSYIRRNAAEALGKIKDERAIPFLTTSLFDDDDSVRERSAWALGEIKDSQAVVDLLNRITDERQERVKFAVVYALRKIKDQRATLALLTELKSESDQLYKNEVVFSLGEIGDPNALPDLTEYLNKLKELKPTEEIIIFYWKQAIKIAEEAIEKIKGKQ